MKEGSLDLISMKVSTLLPTKDVRVMSEMEIIRHFDYSIPEWDIKKAEVMAVYNKWKESPGAK